MVGYEKLCIYMSRRCEALFDNLANGDMLELKPAISMTLRDVQMLLDAFADEFHELRLGKAPLDNLIRCYGDEDLESPL